MSSPWNLINSEETLLPFIVPFVGFFGTFLYCVSHPDRPNFHKWHLIHDIHHIAVIILSLFSLYFDDDTIFNERIGILWAMAFYAVDCVDCLSRGRVAYTVHALLCCTFAIAALHVPFCRELRYSSRIAQFAWSTPVLHYAMATRKPRDFFVFALVFFLCRIVFFPLFIILPGLRHGLSWTHWLACGAYIFYGLNLYWFYRIVRMIVRGKADDDEKTKEADNNGQEKKKFN
jgi:hypothetical protein